MTIYDFMISCNNTYAMEFTIFDCNTENVISFEDDEELQMSKYVDYDIGGMDIWWNNKNQCIHVEFNIDIEEDD